MLVKYNTGLAEERNQHLLIADCEWAEGPCLTFTFFESIVYLNENSSQLGTGLDQF